MTDNISEFLTKSKSYGFIKGTIKAVNLKKVREWDIAELTVEDVTGSILLAVFNPTKTFTEGQVIEANHCIAKEFKGQIQLSLAKNRGEIIVIGNNSSIPASNPGQSNNSGAGAPASTGGIGMDPAKFEEILDRVIGKYATKITNKITEIQVSYMNQVKELLPKPDQSIPDDYFDQMEDSINGD